MAARPPPPPPPSAGSQSLSSIPAPTPRAPAPPAPPSHSLPPEVYASHLAHQSSLQPHQQSQPPTHHQPPQQSQHNTLPTSTALRRSELDDEIQEMDLGAELDVSIPTYTCVSSV